MVQGFSRTNRHLSAMFFTIIVIAGAAAVRSLYFLAKAYHGQTYNQLPKLADMFKVLQEYAEYFKGQGSTETDALKRAEEEFENNLRYRITEAVDQNLTSNNTRLEHMHQGIVWLFVLLVSIGAAAVPYGIDRIIAPATVPVVHIENLDARQEKEVAMPEQKPDPVSQPRPSGSTPKPSFPSNIVTKSDRPVATTTKK
jgi:hypothetical protein